MKSVIFDLDGTLINSAPDILAAVNRTLSDRNVEPINLVTLTSFIGNGLPHLVRLTMEHVGLPLSEHAAMSKKTLAYYNSASANLTQFYNGVPEFLQYLNKLGVTMGICTNKPYEPTMDILQKFHIIKYFDVVIGGDSLPQRKPDPTPLQRAIDTLGAKKILYVGDSEVDAETALRARVPFALFTRGYRNTPVDDLPHVIAFEDFSELREKFDKLL
jgi:phosphoglycolate phosphatase